MADKRAAVGIYSTRVPVDRWLGLTLLAIAAVFVVALPAAQVVLLAGVLGGVVIAAFSIVRQRHTRR
jgi:hypothetical protein